MYLSDHVMQESHFIGTLNALRLNHGSHTSSDDPSMRSVLRTTGCRSLTRVLFFLLLSTVGMLIGVNNAFAQNSTIFGPNVYVFNPSESTSSINATLNTLNANSQFSTNRYAVLFQPGTYTGVEAEVGYYESVAGLGQEPTAVAIANGYLTSIQDKTKRRSKLPAGD